MNRPVGVSELRRRPMQIVREAQRSAEGTVITFRRSPVAVLRGMPAPCEYALGDGSREGESPGDAGASGKALGPYAAWLAADGDSGTPDADAVLDSASWGLWEGLSDAQRRALMRAVQEQRGGVNGEVACENRLGDGEADRGHGRA